MQAISLLIGENKALELGWQGFFARNQSNGIKQLVLALVEGDQQQLAEFKEAVLAAKPEGSNVEDIAFEDYSGPIISTDAFMLISLQISSIKAFPPCCASIANRIECWRSRTECWKSKMRLFLSWKRSDQT